MFSILRHIKTKRQENLAYFSFVKSKYEALKIALEKCVTSSR
jgi:hypothetical protein